MDIKKRNLPHNPNLFLSSLIGGGLSLAVMLVLALVFPLVALRFDDPNAFSAPAAYISVFAGALAGSFVASTKNREIPIRAGMLSGATMLVPMALVSFMIPGGGSFVSAFSVIATIVVASFLGAYAVLKLGKSSKRNMKKAMKRR